MATPGQLVAATAAAFQLSEGTVRLFDRELAAIGLRSRGGRGRSAARVTPVDVANLVIAFTGSGAGETVREATERVPLLAAMPFRIGSSSEEERERRSLGLPALARLAPDHLLGDMVAGLVESLWSGAMDGPSPADTTTLNTPAWSGWLEIERPQPRATVTVLPPRGSKEKASLQNTYIPSRVEERPDGWYARTTVRISALRALTRRLGTYEGPST